MHLAFFGSRCLKSVVHERTLRRETENVPGETRYDNWTQQHPCHTNAKMTSFQQKKNPPAFISYVFCEHLVERGNEPDEAQHGSLSKYHYLCETHKSNSMKSK